MFNSDTWVYVLNTIEKSIKNPLINLIFFIIILLYLLLKASIIAIFYDSFRSLKVNLVTNEIIAEKIGMVFYSIYVRAQP